MSKRKAGNEARHDLARRLRHEFTDAALLQRALTHRSYGGEHNERLEFLGDSVLNFIISDTLFDRFPKLTEGELTRLRASLVKKETLARLARTLKLGDCLELGIGEYKSGGHDRDSILADSLEAVVGAVFKDAGYRAARSAILVIYANLLRDLDPEAVSKDPKTRLQEFLQQRELEKPVYQVIEIRGEAHSQHFLVECRVPGIAEGIKGEGASRRGAEQQAAAKAYEALTARQ